MSRIPAAPLTAHIHALVDAGWTRRSIALSTGVAYSTVWRLYHRQQPQVHAETARLLLALDADTTLQRGATGGRRDLIDEAVVLRILEGHPTQATRAEREEVVRRWKALGRPLKQLGEITGWKPERYRTSTAEAA